MRRVVDFLWRPAVSPMFVFMWCVSVSVWDAWGPIAWLAWVAFTYAVEVTMSTRAGR